MEDGTIWFFVALLPWLIFAWAYGGIKALIGVIFLFGPPLLLYAILREEVASLLLFLICAFIVAKFER